MTPSIVKNVVRMPKQRAKQVRARISYMSKRTTRTFSAGCEGIRTARTCDVSLRRGSWRAGAGDCESADLRHQLQNEQIHIARLKGSLDSTQNLLKVKGNALFDEKAVLKAWLAVREADADNFVFNSQKSTK